MRAEKIKGGNKNMAEKKLKKSAVSSGKKKVVKLNKPEIKPEIKAEETDAIDNFILFVKNKFNEKKEGVPAKKVKITGKALAITAVVSLFVLLLVFQTTVAVKKSVQFNKKPSVVVSWSPKYLGQAGMPVSGNHLYVLDNGALEVKKYSKMEGNLMDVYRFKDVPRWAAETKAGETLIMITGSDKILKYSGKKETGTITIPGLSAVPNFVIDSSDNLYFPDTNSAKIIKYSLSGEKLLEFGGRGSNKGAFIRLGKIFADNKDNIHAMEFAEPYKVKVFSSDGKFIREWLLKLKSIKGPESLAITHDGNTYVNDMNENCVQVYNQKGQQIGKFKSDISGNFGVGIPGALSGGQDNFIYLSGTVLNPIDY